MRYVYTIGAIVSIAILLYLMFLYERFMFNDCLRVGHSTAYCVLDFGGR